MKDLGGMKKKFEKLLFEGRNLNFKKYFIKDQGK